MSAPWEAFWNTSAFQGHSPSEVPAAAVVSTRFESWQPFPSQNKGCGHPIVSLPPNAVAWVARDNAGSILVSQPVGLPCLDSEPWAGRSSFAFLESHRPESYPDLSPRRCDPASSPPPPRAVQRCLQQRHSWTSAFICCDTARCLRIGFASSAGPGQHLRFRTVPCAPCSGAASARAGG